MVKEVAGKSELYQTIQTHSIKGQWSAESCGGVSKGNLKITDVTRQDIEDHQ